MNDTPKTNDTTRFTDGSFELETDPKKIKASLKRLKKLGFTLQEVDSFKDKKKSDLNETLQKMRDLNGL
jgi:hypothetical protein